MKIVVVNAYVRENGGDAALLSVLLSQLKEAYPEVELVIAGMEDPAVRPEFEGVKNIGSIRRYAGVEDIPTLKRLMRKGLTVLVGSIWFRGSGKKLWGAFLRVLPSEVRAELAAIHSSDAVVALGGGYLNGKNNLGGDFNVYYLLLPARLARRLSKPIVFAPQSYGPFGNVRQLRWASKTLNNTDLIMVREETSMEILKNLDIANDLLYKTVDSGFAFEVQKNNSILKELGISTKKKIVGVTARRWLSPKAQEAFEKSIAKTIDYIQAKHNMQVVLIPQVTSSFQADDDRIVEKRIASFCDSNRLPIVVDQAVGHQGLKALYGELDYLIGTRFHSVIFGLTSYVPSIAIEYEHKTGGIMHDLKLDDWVIKMQDVTEPKLSKMFDLLVSERKNYLNHLQKFLPPYIELAKSTPSLIKKALSKNASHASKR